MIVTSLDLEMNQPSQKIVQIGAVVGDLRSGAVLERLCIDVAIDEPLNPFITTLTGITEEQLRVAGTLDEAYQKLAVMHQKANAYCNPITWGGGDSAELRRQLGLDDARFLFGRRWLDIKTLYQLQQMGRGEKPQAGLAKAMTKRGLAFKGRKHNAGDDALNTFLFAAHLLRNTDK